MLWHHNLWAIPVFSGVRVSVRRVWRYQRGNQNPYIEEEYTTQWPKKRSTKHTHKTKDRVIRIPLKTGGELMWSGTVSCSCSTSGIRRVNLVTNPVKYFLVRYLSFPLSLPILLSVLFFYYLRLLFSPLLSSPVCNVQ